MQKTQVFFIVLQHVRKNIVNLYITFFLLISKTVINRETSLIFSISLWESIVFYFFGRKVKPLSDIQFNGLNIYMYNRGYLINKVYFSAARRVRVNKINLIKNNPFILGYSTSISSPTPVVIYSNLESEKSSIYADNRDKSGVYL